jgi:ADP-ribose pyrophosphatase YjhB (NUDIX family)
MKYMREWKDFVSEVEAEEEREKTNTFSRSGNDAKQDDEPDEYKTPFKQNSRGVHFGQNPDELQCVIDLRHAANRQAAGRSTGRPPEPSDYNAVSSFYDCMEEHGYEKLGAGSFRAVFAVTGHPDLVLKIVSPTNHNNPKPAMGMNRKEAQGLFQTTSDLVPKVYDSARDYYWIISEKVDTIKDWTKMQDFFPMWREENNHTFQAWFERLISSKTKQEAAINILDAKKDRYKLKNSAKDLVNDPLILQIRDLLARFDLPVWDIRPYNVGYATRNGEKQFVILDPGFELDEIFPGKAGSPRHDEITTRKGSSAIYNADKKPVPPTQYSEGQSERALQEVLTKQWQLFLENRSPHDFLYDISKSANKITITLLDPVTKDPVESKKEGTDAYISIEKRTDVPNWEVSWASSPIDSEGVGTIMYLMALEQAEEGLAPDSYETSPDARRIWEKFMNSNEYGVKKELKDGHEGEDESDPFNFVFFKPKKTILARYQDKIIEKDVESEEKVEFDPEKDEKVEYFDPKQFNWEDLDELYENLVQDEDTDAATKVIMTDKSGNILILRRSERPHRWDLPGGHIQHGENPEDGARRETKEETSLDISSLTSLNTAENTHFYKCDAPKGDIQLQKEEHTDFMWVNPKEMDKYNMKKHLKDAISSVFDVMAEQNEPYQRYSKGTYKKFIAKLAKQGKNKYNVGGAMKTPSTKHLKSGPPGG